jgi:hypothetical protein
VNGSLRIEMRQLQQASAKAGKFVQGAIGVGKPLIPLDYVGSMKKR